MSDLKNQKDVKESEDAVTGGSSGFIKLGEGDTFVALVDSRYENEYAHFVPVGGRKTKVGCGGGLKGKGFDPDGCALCSQSLKHYQLAKELAADGEAGESAVEKKKGGDIRASFQAYFKAIKGELIRIKDEKTGKVRTVAEYAEKPEVGILAFTQAQFRMLTALVGDERYPFIESPSDLVGRTLKFTKKVKTDKSGKQMGQYAEVVDIIPSKNKLSFKVEGTEAVDLKGQITSTTDEERQKVLRLYLSATGGKEEDGGGLDEELELNGKKGGKQAAKPEARKTADNAEEDIGF